MANIIDYVVLDSTTENVSDVDATEILDESKRLTEEYIDISGKIASVTNNCSSDYCDIETSIALCDLGCIPYNYNKDTTIYVSAIVSLYDAQKWLREEKDIYIYPVVDKFLDEDGDTTWITYMYVPYASVRALCKRKRYEDALLEGIKEAINFIKTTK